MARPADSRRGVVDGAEVEVGAEEYAGVSRVVLCAHGRRKSEDLRQTLLPPTSPHPDRTDGDEESPHVQLLLLIERQR